jgi:hypothetical protein
MNHDVEIDLDEVLDMDGDNERRSFLLSLLTDAKRSQDVVDVNERNELLLTKMNLLFMYTLYSCTKYSCVRFF